MSTVAGRLAVAAMSVVVAAGCDSSGGSASTGNNRRICAGTHQPPPAPSLTFAAEGHPRNTWSLPVGTDGVTVRFAITQRPDTSVATVRFVIAPANGRHPGGEVRRFAPVGENWPPGEHSAAVTWDGKDDDGKPVAPGQYRLFADAITTTTRDVECADGSGKGIERFSDTYEAAGIGRFSIGRTAAPCPNQRDFNDPRLTRAAVDVSALPSAIMDHTSQAS